MFKTPWLEFEKQKWPVLEGDVKTQVAIVGGGISGVSALYFLLKNTDKQIILLEKKHIASGATGHNAGIVASFLEKPISLLIEEFGVDLTRQALNDMDAGWDILNEILKEIGRQEDLILFESGRLAINSIENLITRLQEERAAQKLGQVQWKYIISKEVNLPDELVDSGLDIKYVSQQDMQNLLQLNEDYIACAIPVTNARRGRLNSAKFCYDVLYFLQEKFPERFAVYEHTKIEQINLYAEGCILQHANGEIIADDVILCTNAYKDFAVCDKELNASATKIQDEISQVEGYMAGFKEHEKDSCIKAFLIDNQKYKHVPLFYFCRAPQGQTQEMLSVVGGPEYVNDQISPEIIEAQAKESMDAYRIFLKETFNFPGASLDYFWHGTMGYTPNGLRWVGRDPEYPQLIYNLGCNGIGIILALVSAKKLAGIVSGIEYPVSLFDI